MPMPKSNQFQLVIMVVSILAMMAIMGTGWRDVQRQEAAVHVAGAQTLEAAHSKVVNLMASIVVDLNGLANSLELGTYLKDGSSSAREELQSSWLEFSDSKTLYDQVRFIDDAGMEIVRVNHSDHGALGVPLAQLQDKSARYYFKDSIALSRGEVFISALDLNKEKGKVEEPFKPMLSLGLPAFDAKGYKRGILLVNVLAQEILDLVQLELNGPPFDAMMLNDDGFWLLAPDQGDAWSSMFEGERSFPARYPQVWERIVREKEGRLQNQGGLFLFRTVFPMNELVPKIPGLRLAAGQNNYHWILVAHASEENLDSMRNNLIGGRSPWLLLTLVLLLQSGIAFFRQKKPSVLGNSDSAQ